MRKFILSFLKTGIVYSAFKHAARKMKHSFERNIIEEEMLLLELTPYVIYPVLSLRRGLGLTSGNKDLFINRKSR